MFILEAQLYIAITHFFLIIIVIWPIIYFLSYLVYLSSVVGRIPQFTFPIKYVTIYLILCLPLIYFLSLEM